MLNDIHERCRALAVQNIRQHAWVHKAKDGHTYIWIIQKTHAMVSKAIWDNFYHHSVILHNIHEWHINKWNKSQGCGTSFHRQVPARCGHICPPRQPVSLMRENIPWRTLNLYTHNATGLSNPFRSRQGERKWAFEPTEVYICLQKHWKSTLVADVYYQTHGANAKPRNWCAL